MNKPQVNDIVNVVTHAGIRPGVVVYPFRGNIQVLADRLGITEEEADVLHGMRTTIKVQYEEGDGLPTDFLVRHMEHDPSGQRLGTWHYPEASNDPTSPQ